MKKKTHSFSLFSDEALVILVSLVTLLLQLISFATTWNGTKIYLENIFPCASLFFAIAIQATAYFLSNSLRNRIGCLKILALVMALCCSTYYSYIGIYNSVNSPVSYLQERYTEIADELTNQLAEETNIRTSQAKKELGDAGASIIARYYALTSELANIESCRQELSEIDTSHTDSLRAPSKSAYENYEDYVAAYNAYIAGISSGSRTETDAAQALILASYGFSSMEELQTAEQQTTATLQVLLSTLSDCAQDATTNFPQAVTLLQGSIYETIDATALGISPTSVQNRQISCFFQTASLCEYEGQSALLLCADLEFCAKAAAAPLLTDYQSLVASLLDGQINDGNIMTLKTAMDSEIMSAILTLNSILPQESHLSLNDTRYQITDLYLVPITALQKSDTRMTALFCLFVATLVDFLSVLFAISLKKKKPLWEKRFLGKTSFVDLETQIFASLPMSSDTDDATCRQIGTANALHNFLTRFSPSPLTENDGYMMVAKTSDLKEFQVLAALLCQVNLAKIVPESFLDNTDETLLLKARFVLWANQYICHARKEAAYE